MALGEHFTHVSDTVRYYPRKHKSSVPRWNKVITVGCWGGEEVLCAQVSPRFVVEEEDVIGSFLNEAVCSGMKQEDGDGEMMMLQSVFLISPGVFGHSRSPQSLLKAKLRTCSNT